MTGLGRKQGIADQAAWEQAAEDAVRQVSAARLDDLIASTADRIRSEAARGRLAYGWSGGKDSQVLRLVAEEAGVADCVLVMTTGLEWPAMLRWQTDHMPPGCEIVTVPLDVPWLAAHPRMLFPQGPDGPRWFSIVQHKGERQYYRRRGLDALLLGRRRKDGNYVGPAGRDKYTSRHGVTIWSPLADWTHEHVLALIARRRIPLPPCYSWPRGYQVGTGPWPARQWTSSPGHGFAECWQIDPSVIRAAAPDLPAAAAWMAATGRT